MGPLKDSISKYCIHPIKCGFIGFAIFLLVIIGTKFLGAVLGSFEKFTLDMEDFVLSTIGFIMFFLIKILNNFNERQV